MSFVPSQIEHRYGSNVFILNNPFLLTLLNRLCQEETTQPTINDSIEILYSQLLATAAGNELEREQVKTPTRMTQFHSDQFLSESIIKYDQKAVTVNLARAGTFPSHICYNTLNRLLKPSQVRQDHIWAARKTGENERVIGTDLGGTKIGGDVDKAVVFFPDPMGATGGTIDTVIDLYESAFTGKARRFVALHLIVTPEYLKRLGPRHPNLSIYALRVDRGLSPKHVLDSVPGTNWELERGLNDKQYIVPGAGGLGELLNNSFV